MFPWPDSGEPLRFDRFMAAALHDPERGYYARRIRKVGARGDFSTTASISPVLARAIAAWAVKALRETQCRDLIELGPGNGTLAAGVLRNLPWWKRPRLHLVESSAPLREHQRKLLGDKVRWHDTVEAALAACGGNACLYSNEFVDAFPVRRFRKEPGGWTEQHLTPDADHWFPADDLPESSSFDRDWPDGQIVEVHDSVHEWLGSMLSAWNRGRMLTIDYGSEVDGLYHRQPAGTFRAYFHHQCLTGPEALARPGHQDLTADVNFTDLQRWSETSASTLSLRTQAEFLRPFADSDDDAQRFITHSDGAGSAFLVLDTERRL